MSSHDAITQHIKHMAELAGVHVHSAQSQAVHASSIMRIDDTHTSEPVVRITFHPAYAPYFETEKDTFHIEDDAHTLLDMMISVGSINRGSIIGVINTHGGVGASTIAFCLAQRYAQEHTTALIDLDPTSSGIDAWNEFQGITGLRWPDIHEESGTLVPGRLTQALPQKSNLRLLSADQRGSVDLTSSQAYRAISALSQNNEITILDIPRHSIKEHDDILQWCDILLIVTESNKKGARQLAAIISDDLGECRLVAVANKAKSGTQVAAFTQDINDNTLTTIDVLPVRSSKMFNKDIQQGMPPNTYKRSGMNKDINALFSQCKELLS